MTFSSWITFKKIPTTLISCPMHNNKDHQKCLNTFTYSDHTTSRGNYVMKICIWNFLLSLTSPIRLLLIVWLVWFQQLSIDNKILKAIMVSFWVFFKKIEITNNFSCCIWSTREITVDGIFNFCPKMTR